MKDPDRAQPQPDESSGDLEGRRASSWRPRRSALGLAASSALGRGLAACALLGCSAATDVVAVDNSDPAAAPAAATTDVGALVEQDNGALGRLVMPPLPTDQAAGSTLLIVAGLPVPDWQGPTFDWPLATPLHTFFSDASTQPGDGNSETADPPAGVFARSNRTDRASGFASSGGYAPPTDNSRHVSDTHSNAADAERDAFQHLSTTDVGASHDIHLVASTGSAAERLRSLFLAVPPLEHKEPSLVARDAFNDRYLVILEADSCGMPSAPDPAVAPDEACSKGARLDHE